MVTVRFVGHRPPYEAGETTQMDEAEAENLERKGLVELVEDEASAAAGWPIQRDVSPRDNDAPDDQESAPAE